MLAARRIQIPALAALATWCTTTCVRGPEEASGATPVPVAASVHGVQPAMQAYRDPVTGRLTAPSATAGAAPSQTPPRAQSLSSGLVETPTPYGGVIVHLPDSFSSDFVATIAADGSVRAHCDEPHPAGRR